MRNDIKCVGYSFSIDVNNFAKAGNIRNGILPAFLVQYSKLDKKIETVNDLSQRCYEK